MKSFRKAISLSAIFSLIASAFLVCASAPARADIMLEVGPVKTTDKGTFQIVKDKAIPAGTVFSAVVETSDEEKGEIDEIIITGPGVDGPATREFGCINQRVQDGTDLIKTCGGPAVLKAGQTKYVANGHGFSPNVPFTVNLTIRED